MSTPLISTLKTPICRLLGCDVSVVLAGMGCVAGADLVAAVTASGSFSFLGMVRETPELIRSEIDRVRAATTRDFGVNLIPAGTDPDLLEAELDAVIAEQVAAVALFWDFRPDIVHRLCDSGCLSSAKSVQFGRQKKPPVRGLTSSLLKASRRPVMCAGRPILPIWYQA